ncbi:hypothetical protein [Candidatus Pristimantibacillus sp. PTI5]|uniref:hypothetical protein n=1 Tax=Candidatus Pristimantibacillus sp. PTI5 TaxID=3400422 RepID=UPI003B014C06
MLEFSLEGHDYQVCLEPGDKLPKDLRNFRWGFPRFLHVLDGLTFKLIIKMLTDIAHNTPRPIIVGFIVTGRYYDVSTFSLAATSVMQLTQLQTGIKR